MLSTPFRSLAMLVAAIVAALFHQSVSAQSPHAPSIRDHLQTQYRRIDAAYKESALEIISDITTPDAMLVIGSEKIPLRTALEKVIAALRAGVTITRQTSVVSAQLMPTGEAVASLQVESSMTVGGQVQSEIATNRDVWVKVNDGWRLRESQRLSAHPSDGATAPIDSDLLPELRRYAIPLSSTNPHSGFDDLKFFGAAVGNARIVALGEATHGTSEFFKLKHRLLEYLVTEKGFTVLAVEGDWPRMLAVDRYVKTGKGDPKPPLRGLIHLQTAEMLDLIEWIRDHNRKTGPKITFTGFDMQVFDDAIEIVMKFFEQVDSPDQEIVRESYRKVRKLGPRRVRFEDGAKLAAREAEKVVNILDKKQELLTKVSTTTAWQNARQAAEVARQAAAFRIEENGTGYRDDMMARNAAWLARQAHPNEKIVLWAHNGHIALGGTFGERSMGQGLREAFGNDLYVVGFSFSQGSVRAVGIEGGRRATWMDDHAVPAPPSGSGGTVLRSAGMPLFFLDMAQLPTNTALGRWLAQPHLFYEIGAGWNKDDPKANLIAKVLAKSYDGLVFVDKTNPARTFGE